MRMVKIGVWDGVGSTGRDKTGSGANVGVIAKVTPIL